MLNIVTGRLDTAGGAMFTTPAVDARALATFLPSWQGVDRHPTAGAGVARLREALVGIQNGTVADTHGWVTRV